MRLRAILRARHGGPSCALSPHSSIPPLEIDRIPAAASRQLLPASPRQAARAPAADPSLHCIRRSPAPRCQEAGELSSAPPTSFPWPSRCLPGAWPCWREGGTVTRHEAAAAAAGQAPAAATTGGYCGAGGAPARPGEPATPGWLQPVCSWLQSAGCLLCWLCLPPVQFSPLPLPSLHHCAAALGRRRSGGGADGRGDAGAAPGCSQRV